MAKNPSKGGRDNFPTPQIYADYAIRSAIDLKCSLLEREPLQPGYIKVLEPGCGAHMPFLVAAENQLSKGLRCMDDKCFLQLNGVEKENWKSAVDMQSVALHGGAINVAYGADFLDVTKNFAELGLLYDFIVTNPPFSICEKFIERCFDLLAPEGVMVFLLRLPVLGGEKRMHLWETRPPVEVATFIRRISFDGEGTDYSEYGLFFWLGTEIEKRYRSKHKQNGLKFYWIDNTSKTLKKTGGLRVFGL
jgi:hypothetical protein